MSRNVCVIFDLDGTLVDSESLCNQAFLDLIPELDDPPEVLVEQNRGRRLSAILADIESRIGKRLPLTFEAEYRAHVATLFSSQLKPMPGVATRLQRLDAAKCVASSGPRSKILQALEISGLAPHFGDAIFSSYEVASWKPEPDLFLHAALAMGYPPERCAVVDDSDLGVEAAIAAGMSAFHYLPDGRLTGFEGAKTIGDMAHLLDLLDQTHAPQQTNSR